MTGALFALAGAVLTGAGLARQHAVASTFEPHAAMDPRLLLRLARRRSWLLGIALANGGFVLIATGIATGRLAVVEPVAATQVLFALLFASRASGRRLGRAEWLAAGATLVGLASFLAVAAPTHEADAAEAVPWVVPLAAVATLVMAGVTSTRTASRSFRGVALAALAGITFGTADALIKAMSELADGGGAGALLGDWPLYTWMAAGLTAMLLQQSAYQAAHLGAALPATCALAPTTATLLGALMLGERLRGGWAIPAELALFGLLLAGVVRLAASPVLSGGDGAPATAGVGVAPAVP